MNEIKCKDYFIFKVQTYADKKVLDEWHLHKDAPMPKQHWERVKSHIEFFHSLVEKLTGKGMNHWALEFGMFRNECLRDELSEFHGIHIHETEGTNIYMIPKDRTDLIQWFKDNLQNPYKILKKVDIRFTDFIGKSDRREHSREGNKEIREKYKNIIQ